MKRKRQYSKTFRRKFKKLLVERYGVLANKKHEIENQFLWVWRFLFTWGWNGKEKTFSISWYKPDYETKVWSIGDY